ncbi:hypothetical protein [Streptomyces sp. NPDC001127]
MLPVISRKGGPNIKDLGKRRYVVEQAFSLLHHFKHRPLGSVSQSTSRK